MRSFPETAPAEVGWICQGSPSSTRNLPWTLGGFFSLLSKKRKEEKGKTNEAPYSKLPSTQRNGKGQVNYVPFPVQSRKEPPEEGNHGRLC